MVRVAIARGLPEEALIPALRAVWEGGFTHLEITMNTPGAEGQIRRAREALGPQVPLGAGTVRTMEELQRALDAGATFVVTPHTDPQLIGACRDRGIPIYAGALTPTEVWQAWQAGATLIKLFPVGRMGGPDYLRDLAGPFEQVPLLACGGVTPENWPQYQAAGARGLAVGASLFHPQWLQSQNWVALTNQARLYSI